MTLITTAHLEAPDDFYEALLNAHKDLSATESHAFNARLILLLANHIGRLDVLKDALAAASASCAGAASIESTDRLGSTTANAAATRVDASRRPSDFAEGPA